MTDAYDLIINILTSIGVYDQILNAFRAYGIESVLKLLIVLIEIAVLFVFVLVTVMFLTWLERKVVAKVQVRYGPMITGPHGLYQPLMDGIKLIGKEDIIPEKADRWIF